MTLTALTRTTLTGIGVASAAVTFPSVALAQDALPDMPKVEILSDVETQSLPPELQTAPRVAAPISEAITDADGVETITRTRRITRSAPPDSAENTWVSREEYEVEYAAPVHSRQFSQAYAPGAQVFQRDQWIAECENRTDGQRGRKKGGIIGGLLGAIAGGIIGNRVWDSERLGGTLIGIGAGGIGGALLGSLIGGGRNDRGEYDCEAALARNIPTGPHALLHAPSRHLRLSMPRPPTDMATPHLSITMRHPSRSPMCRLSISSANA